jgi:hypothetical protein
MIEGMAHAASRPPRQAAMADFGSRLMAELQTGRDYKRQYTPF